MTKIGIVASCFDLLHAGHIDMLLRSKARCDKLLVAFQTSIPDRPEKNQPIQTVLERYVQIAAIKYVDELIPYESEEDLKNLLHLVGPHVRLLGEEYRGKKFTGWEMYESSYADKMDPNEPPYSVVYLPRKHNFSTTGLRKRIYDAEHQNVIKKKNDLPRDHWPPPLFGKEIVNSTGPSKSLHRTPVQSLSRGFARNNVDEFGTDY